MRTSALKLKNYEVPPELDAARLRFRNAMQNCVHWADSMPPGLPCCFELESAEEALRDVYKSMGARNA